MKAKTRTICIELVCFSILCLLPLMGNSLNVIDSRFHKNVRSKAQDHNRNTPSILNIPIDDTIDINSAKHDISRFKRNSQGNLYSIKTSEIAPLILLHVKQSYDLSKTSFFLGGSEQGVSKEMPVLSSNITSAFHLNNSHLHLMVHWAGKNNPIVFVLSRDQDLTKDNPTSNFYISKDYGRTFTDVSSKFQLSSGKNATLEKFYNHPESPCYYVVTDTIEKVRNY